MLDELEELIDILSFFRAEASGQPYSVVRQLKERYATQLNALFLSQALDLIDQQVIKVWGGIKPSDKYAVSTEELKAAFQAKYGGK